MASDSEDLSEEQTQADDRFRRIAIATQAEQVQQLDEASAENPHRTVRPPPRRDVDVPIDVVHDDPVPSQTMLERGLEPKSSDEDETETMQLTPELRARLDQMAKDSHPPPTRREDD
jgi:hypothetical protein